MSSLDVLPYNRLGMVFCGGNVSAKSVVAVSTTATGLVLYNPYGSGKKFAVIRAGWSWTTAPAAVHNIGLGLGAATPTAVSGTTAAGTGVKLADGTGNAGNAVGLLYDAVTLPNAPVAARWFGGAAYASAASNSPYNIDEDIGGEIMVVAGSCCAFIALTTTAVGVASISWIELPA